MNRSENLSNSLPASPVRAPASRGLTGPPQAFLVSRELPGDVLLRAGVHGRKEVPRGVVVPVVFGATQANPHPVGQGEPGDAPGHGPRRPALTAPHAEHVLLDG